MASIRLGHVQNSTVKSLLHVINIRQIEVPMSDLLYTYTHTHTLPTYAPRPLHTHTHTHTHPLRYLCRAAGCQRNTEVGEAYKRRAVSANLIALSLLY